jgi:histidyl-tRNA synthetase
MVRGTRLLMGKEARELLDAQTQLRLVVERAGFEPVVVSSLQSLELFEGQIGDNRAFELSAERSGRREILLPEVTAVLREQFREHWRGDSQFPKPMRLWYCQRCYRYDRPQRGRWREFWQFGVEEMPAKDPEGLRSLLANCLQVLGLYAYDWRLNLDRGQAYYTKPGFEIWANDLQIAGGGPYAEGQGWAIGLDRLLLVRQEAPKEIALAPPSR